MSTTAPNSYLRDAILTATAEQLQLMLYDGAICFASQGRDALMAKDYETSFERLSRAQAVVSEMETGLRHEINPDVCDRMAAVYRFIYRKLVDGSVNRDPSRVDDALKVLQIERETWVMLIDKVNRARAEAKQDPPGDGQPGEGGLSVEG